MIQIIHEIVMGIATAVLLWIVSTATPIVTPALIFLQTIGFLH